MGVNFGLRLLALGLSVVLSLLIAYYFWSCFRNDAAIDGL